MFEMGCVKPGSDVIPEAGRKNLQSRVNGTHVEKKETRFSWFHPKCFIPGTTWGQQGTSAALKATEMHKTRNPRPFNTGFFFGPYMVYVPQ